MNRVEKWLYVTAGINQAFFPQWFVFSLFFPHIVSQIIEIECGILLSVSESHKWWPCTRLSTGGSDDGDDGFAGVTVSAVGDGDGEVDEGEDDNDGDSN